MQWRIKDRINWCINNDDGIPNFAFSWLYVELNFDSLLNSTVGLRAALSLRPPFGRPLAVYALQELFKKKSQEPDESVDSFFRRRFGADVGGLITKKWYLYKLTRLVCYYLVCAVNKILLLLIERYDCFRKCHANKVT